jgi:DNA polymerase III epsilon subunit-like protein
MSSLRDKGKPTLRVILKQFYRWTSNRKDRLLAGENPWFDAMFLRTASKRYGIHWPFGHRYVDLHSISLATSLRLNKHLASSNGESDLSLDKTLQNVGLEPRTGVHNALDDAKLEAEALSRLIYGKALLKEFMPYKVPAYLRRLGKTRRIL